MRSDEYGFDNIVGKCAKMKRIMEQVMQAAKIDSNVYIYGESGTGKELIARRLHQASSRRNWPFVAFNCAAIPEALLESELFGYKKGAFTGATHDKKGFFTLSDKGTLFLDEISEISISMQVKLLRAIEEKEFYPLGGDKPLQVDNRIITASNKNLEDEVKNGNFRKDLFFRIYVIFFKLPPLRERKEDILPLSAYFLAKYTKKMNKVIKGFSPSASQKLMLHSWPGNVRELENSIEHAVAMTIKDVITEEFIPPVGKIENGNVKSLRNAKENFEKDYLLHLFELTHGNVSKAARLADRHRTDLYKLLRKYNLKPADFRKE